MRIAMNEPDRNEAELVAWSTQVPRDGWVRDQLWSHPDPKFEEALATARRRRQQLPVP